MMKTARPPASGIHAKHRALDTPGPLGWNDHGDPCHWRRHGWSPGSLSVNDHGVPLAKRRFLLSDELDGEVARQINRVINEINAAAHPDAVAALRTGLDACKGADDVEARDDIKQCVLAYFHARLIACEGQTIVERDVDWPAAGSRHGVPIGAVEYRRMGAFFNPLTWAVGGAPHASTSLSYERIGQVPPHSERSAVADRSVHWADEGRADGLRDRVAPAEKLRLIEATRDPSAA
jgi:hypothetical protein